MVKQKLELTFTQGVVAGIIVMFCTMSVIVDKFFVSKDVFNLSRIYVNGRIYKMCEDK